jgi:hypothetical protein
MQAYRTCRAGDFPMPIAPLRRIPKVCLLAIAIAAVTAGICDAQQFGGPGREWLRHVRIAAYPLTPENAEQIVQQAQASGVYGIEVDNDIPGRYESLLMPDTKLEAIRRIASEAHRHGNKAFVYVAGLECISTNADGSHTLAKEHPEWLQRKITGEPAIFNAGAAFWIAKGEEDVWVSPYAADWRKLYMERIRQIAATGIDGIYVDIPYWMTHFTGWEDSWASFDNATVEAFRAKTSLDARKDIKVGDFDDPGFRKWVDFRVETITTFLADLRANAVVANPSISVIPEIYPGIEQEAPRVGADVYQLYPQVDAIAHEYEFGDSEDHTAASRTPFDWFMYQIGMRSFRAFAGEKPTWILNYSWDGAQHVQPRDAMLNLAMSELMAGANVWDAQGHVMSGSNDMQTRHEIFHWIGEHQDIFGAIRDPIGEVGVYFSDTTRNYFPKEFIPSYRGAMLLLLQTHTQFQVVTPRTLAAFRGRTLVLPDVRVLSDQEAASLQRYAANGGRLVLTGQPDHKLDSIASAVRFPDKPEAEYLARAQRDFASIGPPSESAFLKTVEGDSKVRVTASRNVVVHEAKIGGRLYLFFANFDGLKAGEVATPTVQHDVRVVVPSGFGKKLHVLPFLGVQSVIAGKVSGNEMEFAIPEIERGAIAWLASE